jgi:steroid delta-isomerase-like uncharacterized protein
MAETETKGQPKTAAKEKSDGAKPKKQTRPRRSAKSREVEAHVRSYFDAVNARDPEAMASHWSADGVEELVPHAVLRGQDEIAGFFRELFGAMPDLETTVQRVVADDRHAVVEWRQAGTFSGGPFQGIEPTGGRIEMRGLDIFEVEDKQILRNTAYYDGAAVPRQLGMLPAQDSGPERAMKAAFNAATRVRKAVNERRGT